MYNVNNIVTKERYHRTYEPARSSTTYSIYNTVLGVSNNAVNIQATDNSIKINMKPLRGVATNGSIRY